MQFDALLVPWTVQLEANNGSVSEMFCAPAVLYGTMLWHYVFHYRLLLSIKGPLVPPLRVIARYDISA
eukprot:6136176-Pleurochrysis_carterae.AAC.2